MAQQQIGWSTESKLLWQILQKLIRLTSVIHKKTYPEYADNADAISNGLTAGQFYRTGDTLKVVHD